MDRESRWQDLHRCRQTLRAVLVTALARRYTCALRGHGNLHFVSDRSIKTVEFKGEAIQVVRLRLGSLDVQQVAAAFDQSLGGSPDFFDGELAVADLGAVDDHAYEPDWERIREVCAARGLRLVAVTHAGEFGQRARAAGLAVLSPAPAPPRRAQAGEVPAKAPAQAESAPAPHGAASLFVERPLRSGQQIYARGRDVVLLAQASAGSEVIADGNIHVYAPLRGRALAGAQGDTDARIITTCFEPELVSVAGIFQTFDDGIPEALARRPVQVRLSSGGAGKPKLVIEPLTIV
jgi:septum site-determining protein MinC